MLRTRRVGRRVLNVKVVSTVTVLVLGLSACGSTGPRISGGKAPTVLHLTLGQSSGGKALPTAGAMDGVMRPFGDVTYVFDGSLPDLGANAGSWSLAAGAKPDLAKVAAMAKVLGVSGDVRTLPADQGGGWAVGPNDGSAPTFMVSSDGLLTWWYSSAASTVGGGCATSGSAGSANTASTAVASPPDQPVQPQDPTDTAPVTTVVVPMPEPCLAPPVPHGVPDKAAAEAKAKDLLGKMGIDISKYQYTTYADQYSASVNGQLLIDGKPSQISVGIGFGAEGAITYASGQLAEPQPGDVYPLVSTDIGLQRLNDKSGKWQFFGSPAVRNMGGIATGTGTGTDTVTNSANSVAVATGGGAPSVAPGAPATIVDPAAPIPMPSCVAPATTVPTGITGDIAQAPCADTGCYEAPSLPDTPNSKPAPIAVPCTVPTPAPITVHLTSVRASLTMVWTQDSTVWLLPAYTFTSTDGGEYTVVAVDEQYLDMPSATVDTTVVGPASTISDTGSSIPYPTVVPPPSTALAEFVALASKTLVGLTVDEATTAAAGNGWQIRVVELDGVAQAVTADFSATRIDVSVKAGIVAAVDYTG